MEPTRVGPKKGPTWAEIVESEAGLDTGVGMKEGGSGSGKEVVEDVRVLAWNWEKTREGY
jgi:hypothetical protein